MKYKLILLDLDDTILDFKASHPKCMKKLFNFLNIEFKNEYLEIYNKINRSYWKKFENGEITKQYLLNNRFKDFFETIGIKIDIDANKVYLDYLAKADDIIEDTIQVLEKIYKKIKIVVATNGIKYVQESRVLVTKLNKYFDLVVTSEEATHGKPDANFFDFCLKNYSHINKNEILMIGDSLRTDIIGGINYGIDTCWFNPNSNETELKPTYIIKDLKEILDIIN
ncbi:YjjG family noncanonical pyrimidine nucleotidase [Oceanivirga salmonicida]|uniref:YjjG family noncanonical pyrimidine nucleotidase n=1 Tax=Oceanivirga salmonicida TaxID=1769291 RepID=UPI00082A8FDF|nr:YjjG family noncanonical pyrimidine nucleotidase [Oceanivirga salmonicida]